MKTATTFFPAVALAALLLAPASVQAEESNPAWFACTTSDECVITTGACSKDLAVNRNFREQASKAAMEWESCPETGMPDLNATARCVDNKCEITPG